MDRDACGFLGLEYITGCYCTVCCAVYVCLVVSECILSGCVLDGSQLPRFVSSRMVSPPLSVHARHMIPDMGDKDKTAGYSIPRFLC